MSRKLLGGLAATAAIAASLATAGTAGATTNATTTRTAVVSSTVRLTPDVARTLRPPGRSAAERAFVKGLDTAKAARTSEPARAASQRAAGEEPTGGRSRRSAVLRPGRRPPRAPAHHRLSPAGGATVATSNDGALWPGANTSTRTPVGKVYFDTTSPT